jgi:GTPase SAR1 family protein
MFSLVSGLYSEYFSPQQINLLVVGVQGSGKTTILERIKVTNFATQSVTLSSINKNSSIVDDTAIAAAAAAAAVAAAQSSKEYKNSSTKNNTNHSDHHIQNISAAASSHRNHKSAIGPTPELLRSKIFLTDTVDDYQAPTAKRRRKKRTNLSTSAASGNHVSRFGWICPPPPKFSILQSQHTRLDSSDRSSNNNLRFSYNDDDEFSNDGFDDVNIDHNQNQFWDGDDDEDDTDRNTDDDTMDTTLLSTTIASARSRRTAFATAASSNTANGSKIKIVTSNSQHNSNSNNGGPLGLPAPRRITGNVNIDELRKSSMESIDLNDRQRYVSSQLQQQKSFLGNVVHDGDSVDDYIHKGEIPLPQYDIKPHCKMLPLDKIRPTIGMNLCKTEICGAKVHVWDLGGKLQDLWERYYDDADAVLFVWRLNRQDVIAQRQQQDNRTDEEDVVRVTAEQQMKVLEHVRSSVPDDIPFCLLGNIFQVQPPYNCEPDVLYSTGHLLPHYHNPLQALFIANAVSGQGMKSAIEWLISTAKRQQRIRKRSTDV